MRRIRIDVSYHEYGYDLEVVDVETEEVIDTYEAGNSELESTVRLSLDNPHCLSVDDIATNAVQTLYETINEYSKDKEPPTMIAQISLRRGENDTDES